MPKLFFLKELQVILKTKIYNWKEKFWACFFIRWSIGLLSCWEKIARIRGFEMKILKEIESIKERNKRVEADKTWEISWFRRITIATMTYIIATTFLWSIKSPNYWLTSLVPTGGYLLSTLSLSFIKNLWIRNNLK